MTTSKDSRLDKLFLRNEFSVQGKWNMPIVKKQELSLENINLVAYNDVRSNDNEANKARGVHFFIDDYRFKGIYERPQNSLKRLSQYAFLCTPDWSLYKEMPRWRQMESVAKNRWCGAFWQSEGLKVVPTVSWSDALSYEFCFDGIEKNSIVAVGMIGCRKSKLDFLRGYEEMLTRIEPQAVICFGSPFAEMAGNLVIVDYMKSRKVVR